MSGTPTLNTNTNPLTSASTSSVDRRDDLETVEAQAQVIAEHLPAGFTAEFDPALPTTATGTESGLAEGVSVASGAAASSASPFPAEGAEQVESSLKLQGGDIHRELFKLDAQARLQLHRRANTFHTPREFSRTRRDAEEQGEGDSPGLHDITVRDQLAPGGFRRAFLLQNRMHRGHNHDFVAARLPITRNFVEFLDLYGSFAGEDLVDSDEEAVTDEEAEDEEGERRPLLWERGRSRAMSQREAAPAGGQMRNNDAGIAKTFFTLLKAFVGTGIMFLPKAFSNGGLLFSSLAMLGVSAVSMWAFHLLLQCKARYQGGYGEIGHAIAGQPMRNLILASIALSQLGFVCAGIVFVAENLLTFCDAVFKGSHDFSTTGLIAIQVLILVPLAWIRNISKLGPAALLADACILVGVTYIYWFDFSTLARDGIHKSVVLFNPDKYTMMIGSAIFTFEGIGLILPIQSSMAQPEHFEWLLGVVMVIITAVFTSVGAFCYATFGTGTQIEIINNFPQDSPLVNAVQFLYSVAVLVGTPVQLFPALRILETKLFGHQSGKRSLRTKWIKNMFRFSIVIFCGVISVLGTGNLDKFVALIGSAACVPLVYVYPAYLHYKGVAETRWARIGDLVMIVVGLVGMVYTTTVTIVNSFL
ncbi:transmembrane amino acid transporter protein-domain-containing protein [Cladorrhinum samala]|uniref:Transmembrane amino acid transporter protein-domain-containing protein n=1 Tax=Cladorrhinum samala TaxID=585594 RepID=A0AAV9HDP9_9PEZI|nr:transmembrane amino acid transporter protein-domain-containing protein [Cladorrhinum samala]